ncbi:hypothetical protein [Syntrophomonas wolfei]|jgi:hypothetical protein|uniref:hypothetical protein n=1 Tax=Syntrophomonas wolfei TaxID=863 RepID=UPI0023F38F83|nr:hypothetical protein [Syntrophomonas wolfei]
MARVKEITAGVYQVGGDGFSRSEDCCVYLVDGGGESALIDAEKIVSRGINPPAILA